jgi:thioredoxin 1
MKSFKSLAIILVLGIALTGCTSASQEEAEEATTKDTPPKVVQEEKSVVKETKVNENETMSEEETVAAKEETAPQEESAQENKATPFAYEEYSKTKFSELNGQKRFALFFHADWCPTCRVLEKNIKSDLSTFPKNTVILKANYDTELALKKQYGVTTQSSLVFFDEKGNVIGSPLLNPSIAEIKSLLSS